jgi:hypothetical protein
MTSPTTITYNEFLPTLIITLGPQRCSLGMLIVREIETAKTLNSLQSINETTYFRVLETQTKCCSDDGAIARSFPEEKQHDNVLYNQHNTGNRGILIWFCTNVQNGMPVTSPHQQHKANSPRSAKQLALEGNLLKLPDMVELKAQIP